MDKKSFLASKELATDATAFLLAYKTAWNASIVDAAAIIQRGGEFLSDGSSVEYTDELVEKLTVLVIRSTKMLGSKAGNEKTIRDIALRNGHKFVRGTDELDNGSRSLREAIFDQSGRTFEYLLPNHLCTFEGGLRSLKLGCVQAAHTSDYAASCATQPAPALRIEEGPGFSISPGQPVVVTLFYSCWIVKMSSAYENAEEEAKWLIDVMISLLRLFYVGSSTRFPELGAIEPHPLKPTQMDSLGIKIEGAKMALGGSKVPPAYSLNLATRAGIETARFQKMADILCAPPPKSVAERVSQGLGWMTRGRQASDRSERLLFFFTAIEALLSSDDKSAPVVQTIARHAAVIVTNDSSTRASVASEIKSLYGLRSSLVHAGVRSVLHGNANRTQAVVEHLFMRVLDKVDLESKHSVFVQELADASYGLPWH